MNPASSLSEIERKIIAEQLKEICRQAEINDPGINYEASFCSGSSVIRFKFKELTGVFPDAESYAEIENLPGRFEVSLVVYTKPSPEADSFFSSRFGETEKLEKQQGYSIWRKNLFRPGIQAEVRPQALTDWLETDFRWIRRELSRMSEDPSYRPMAFPDPENETYTEGRPLTKESLAWERNPKARKHCLAIYGTACAVCGFDFGKVYGPEYAGKIEVHHRHPLSEIREEHETDPAHDLIPVCPNCHRMLHSKPDGGVFTVEELKELLHVTAAEAGES